MSYAPTEGERMGGHRTGLIALGLTARADQPPTPPAKPADRAVTVSNW